MPERPGPRSSVNSMKLSWALFSATCHASCSRELPRTPMIPAHFSAKDRRVRALQFNAGKIDGAMLIDLGLPTHAADGHPMAAKIVLRIGFNFEKGRLSDRRDEIGSDASRRARFHGRFEPLRRARAALAVCCAALLLGLGDDHVAAIATASVKISSRRR